MLLIIQNVTAYLCELSLLMLPNRKMKTLKVYKMLCPITRKQKLN